ncbi:branched-chain amino acid ABC transporter permease [Dankookia sp. P2]|uniref:branched-chain amino acid ABC transporter permease n=1 Tax=Dankookia sp. P2 TaxID=3423955 RepID=UPI003D668B0B
MDQVLQHLVNGTVLGGTYALLGIGLTLVFGVMRVVNFTHGELYAFGAYMTYALVSLAGVNFFAALPLATLAGVALGALLEARAAAADARGGYRQRDAGDDRRRAGAAERGDVDLGRRRQAHPQPLPGLAAGARPRIRSCRCGSSCWRPRRRCCWASGWRWTAPGRAWRCAPPSRTRRPRR